jgi:beta-glucosidase
MIKILPCARNNRINECSLYDLDRQIRPVGEAFGRLSRRWRNILPTESNNLAAMV